MISSRSEQTLAHVLGDPLVQLMMRADGVDPLALGVELELVAARLPPAKTTAPLWQASRCAGRLPRVQDFCRA